MAESLVLERGGALIQADGMKTAGRLHARPHSGEKVYSPLVLTTFLPR